jgi:flagellar protein FlaG
VPDQGLLAGRETRRERPAPETKKRAVERAPARTEKVHLSFSRKLQYVVDHESNDVTIKVIDPQTDKVLKVLPPEELQRINRKLSETLGRLVDEQA